MMGQSKTRLLGVAVLVAVFAVGALSGAVVHRTAVADNRQPHMQKRGPSLFETLKLTDDQQKQVCTILLHKAEQMKPHDAAIQAAWKEHGPAMKAIMDSTDAAMDSVLTPAQRTQKDTFRAARQKYMQDRMAQEKSQKPESKDAHRSGRPGLNCPGLDEGGSHGPRPWGGDSSHGLRDGTRALPSASPAKPEHQS